MPNKKKRDFSAANYEIGFGKPPKARQYKKGVSGNPSGLPKQRNDVASVADRLLAAGVTFGRNGKRETVSRRHFGYFMQITRALRGDFVALKSILTEVMKYTARAERPAFDIKYVPDPAPEAANDAASREADGKAPDAANEKPPRAA